jgi:hypothetical protein
MLNSDDDDGDSDSDSDSDSDGDGDGDNVSGGYNSNNSRFTDKINILIKFVE